MTMALRERVALKAFHVISQHAYATGRDKMTTQEAANLVADAAIAEVLAAMNEPSQEAQRLGAAEMWQCAVKENSVGYDQATRIFRVMLARIARDVGRE